MENEVETTIMGYIGIIGLYWGYIGIMESKRKTTIMGYRDYYKDAPRGCSGLVVDGNPWIPIAIPIRRVVFLITGLGYPLPKNQAPDPSYIRGKFLLFRGTPKGKILLGVLKLARLICILVWLGQKDSLRRNAVKVLRDSFQPGAPSLHSGYLVTFFEHQRFFAIMSNVPFGFRDWG